MPGKEGKRRRRKSGDRVKASNTGKDMIRRVDPSLISTLHFVGCLPAADSGYTKKNPFILYCYFWYEFTQSVPLLLIPSHMKGLRRRDNLDYWIGGKRANLLLSKNRTFAGTERESKRIEQDVFSVCLSLSLFSSCITCHFIHLFPFFLFSPPSHSHKINIADIIILVISLRRMRRAQIIILHVNGWFFSWIVTTFPRSLISRVWILNKKNKVNHLSIK